MKKFPYTLQTYLEKCQQMVDSAAAFAADARKWGYFSLTRVIIVDVPTETTEITVGSDDDAFKYFTCRNDFETTTFFLRSNPVPGTSFQIRNDGQAVVQVQTRDEGILNSPGTAQLRNGVGAVVTLIARRAKSDEAEAMWDMVGDVEPL